MGGRKNQPICKILGSNPKSELGCSLRNTSFKLEIWFYEIFTQHFSECRNLSFCAHLKNDAFWISTVVLWTPKIQVLIHNINSWIPPILEISACILSFGIHTTSNFIWIISFENNNSLNIQYTVSRKKESYYFPSNF